MVRDALFRPKYAFEINRVPVRMVAPIAKNMADIYVNKMPMVCLWRNLRIPPLFPFLTASEEPPD